MELIEGVQTKSLRVMPDERGRLMEVFRADDPLFERFGQVYVTTAYPGVVKAWHMHLKQTDHMAVVSGMMKIVLYDARPQSKTRGLVNELFVGVHNPLLVVIPPGVQHGFKCISQEEAMVVNVPDLPYNYQQPDEYRLPPNTPDIPYDWARRDG